MTAPADPRLAEVLAGLSGVAPDFLLRQRWFGGKSREVRGLRPVDAAALGPGGPYLALVEVSYADGEPDTYLLPLALRDDAVSGDLAAFRLDGGTAALDATEDESFPPLLYRLIEEGARVPGQAGEFRFCHTRALAEAGAGLRSRAGLPGAARPGAEQQQHHLRRRL
ncbi:MAG TPA: hypothetical protein VNT60_05575, partial [Deinococcales bacterium]|nr:hypothetical protein [Deinococcales bacterium]